MNQQINLYRAAFGSQHWSFATLLPLGGAAGLILLVLVYGFMRWQITPLRAELARLQQQQVDTTHSMEEITKQLSPKVKDAQLETEVTRLQAALEPKRKTVQVSSTEGPGNLHGLSPYMEALARQRLQGLWLTSMALSAGGAHIELTGSTLTPGLVPAYIRRLANEKAFTNIHFRTLLMQRSETDPTRIDFTLRTNGSVPPVAAAAPQDPSATPTPAGSQPPATAATDTPIPAP